nr:uncharacterized protein LOC116283686 [Vicugna pacos]
MKERVLFRERANRCSLGSEVEQLHVRSVSAIMFIWEFKEGGTSAKSTRGGTVALPLAGMPFPVCLRSSRLEAWVSGDGRGAGGGAGQVSCSPELLQLCGGLAPARVRPVGAPAPLHPPVRPRRRCGQARESVVRLGGSGGSGQAGPHPTALGPRSSAGRSRRPLGCKVWTNETPACREPPFGPLPAGMQLAASESGSGPSRRPEEEASGRARFRMLKPRPQLGVADPLVSGRGGAGAPILLGGPSCVCRSFCLLVPSARLPQVRSLRYLLPRAEGRAHRSTAVLGNRLPRQVRSFEARRGPQWASKPRQYPWDPALFWSMQRPLMFPVSPWQEQL